jgi:TP901 family phage tail tape measure protein
MQGKRGEKLDVFNLCAKISLDSSEYESQLKKAKTNTKSAVSDLQNSYTKGFEKVTGTLAKVGTAIAGLGTAVGGYAIKVGGDFEAGMSKVQAISGATGEDMEKLSELAKQMGKTTKFSASEAAEGYQYMAMAGWKTEDMLAGLPGIMNLAAASGESLATTSDIVTNVLTAMGKSAEDAGNFANVLASASSNSNTNVAMMGETFKYVAPIAGALGFNIEDLSQAIGLMANSGIQASQAGTSLRSILTRLASPTDEVEAAMEKYGITIADSDGKMRSLSEIMQNLRESLGGLSEQEQTAAASAIGGQEAMSGLLAIVNASQEDYDKLAGAIANSTDAAENMANTMQDNLQGKLVILKSALEGVGISIYEKFEEPLKNAVDKVTEAVSNFDVDAAIEKIQRVLEILQAIAPVVVGIVSALATLYAYFKVLKVIAKVKGVIAAVEKAGGVVAALGGPVGLVIAAIVAVVAALATLYATNEKFRNFVNNMVSQLVSAVKAAIDGIVTFFTQTLPDAINNGIEFFKSIPERISEFLSNAIASIVQWGSDVKQNAIDAATGFVDNVAEFFSNLPYKVGEFLGSTIAKIIIWATETAENAKEAGEDFLNNVVEFFTQLPTNVWNFLMQTITNVMNWAWQMKENAVDAASNFLNSVVEFFTQLPGKAKEKFDSTIEKVVAWAVELKEKGETAAKELVDAVITGMEELPQKIFDMGVNAAKKLVDGIKSMASWVKKQVSSFVDGIVDGFTGTMKANGSHAGGLDYVPYNNYVANLHRGEMVLTAREAEKYRRGAFGGGGFTVQQTIYAAKQSPVELAASTAAAFQRARWALA